MGQQWSHRVADICSITILFTLTNMRLKQKPSYIFPCKHAHTGARMWEERRHYIVVTIFKYFFIWHFFVVVTNKLTESCKHGKQTEKLSPNGFKEKNQHKQRCQDCYKQWPTQCPSLLNPYKDNKWPSDSSHTAREVLSVDEAWYCNKS